MRTLLKNGKIYIEKNTFVEALLIEDGIIKKYGTNEELSLLDADEIVDLEGKTVLPGLNDSHLHLAGIGSAMSSCNLTPARSIDDLIRIGREFIEDNPGLTAMFGGGWNQDYFTSGEKRMPTRFDLDKISTEIPIVFSRVCGHMATGNTKALELLKIDENTTIDGGEIELDTNGKPTGLVNENAVGFLKSVIPNKTKKDIEDEFLKAADYAISLGITSVQSCDIRSKDPSLMFDLIRDIYKNEKTKLRFGHQFNFQDISGLRDYLNTEFVTGQYDEKFLSKGALKLFIDGSLGARTALMLNDYKDAPGTKGVEVLTLEQLDNICSLAAENGIKIVTHAIGDGAIEMIINAYEKLMVNGENPLRHGIVHCQITSMELLERIARLNIPVMYQPIFLDYDLNIVEDRVGKELASTSYAFNTLYKLGTAISLSTDAPVEDCNPWHNLYCAVTRMGLDGKPEGGFYPNEKMDLQDAIDCYTYGSAYNEFKEDFKGRLKPGFVADLIVLDRDIFTINPEEIKDIVVERTMIDGVFIER
ncbi:amidohydrolase [Tissierella sp.]|uniref:amidohydrolase n=1 Tax=Tissierella sp. TaxID=41274 RepID=UPI00285DB81E|nr:amidohydrolase [Tissierella sp.]MDR7856807.1 amidohydrolase [Tissierella sp.]